MRVVAALLVAFVVSVGGASAGGIEGPVNLAAGYGSVWVGFGEGKVVQVDPQTGRVVRIVPPSLTGFVSSLTAGFGSIWLARHDGTVVRIDGRTGRLLKTISLSAASLAAGERYMWAADGQRTIRRIDPQTNRVTGTKRVPGLLWGRVVAGPAGVWVQSLPGSRITGPEGTRILWRVHRGTLALKRVAKLRCAANLAVGRSLWALDGCTGSLFQPGRKPIRVTEGASEIAVGADAVWIARGLVVQRVDLRKRAIVARIAADGEILAVTDEAVWLLDIGDAITGWLRRIDPATNRLIGRPIRLSARS